MKRNYVITLDFNPNKPHSQETPYQEYSVFINRLKGYLLSLDLFSQDSKETFIAGSHLFLMAKDGSLVDITYPGSEYMLSSIKIGYREPMEELEAIRHALMTAKQLELAKPPFDPKLTFNPNLIYLFVGADTEGNYTVYSNFIQNAKELQARLYGGGNIAYRESSGHFHMFLGIENEFRNKGITRVIEFEGAAKPANSLDELLARLEQKPQ